MKKEIVGGPPQKNRRRIDVLKIWSGISENNMAAKIKLRLHAKVGIDKEGAKCIVFRSPQYVAAQLAQYMEGKDIVVLVETMAPRRSLNQNAYLWGIVYPIIAEATGYSETEVHEWSKSAYLKPRIIKIKGKAHYVTSSTTSLSVSDMVEYIDKLCLLALELGSRVPTPAESGYISNHHVVPISRPRK